MSRPRIFNLEPSQPERLGCSISHPLLTQASTQVGPLAEQMVRNSHLKTVLQQGPGLRRVDLFDLGEIPEESTTRS